MEDNKINFLNDLFNIKRQEKLAFQFFMKKNFREAEIIYRQIIDLPNLEEVSYFNFALICSQKGNLDEASTNIQKALEINPSNYDGIILLSNIYKKQNKLKEALFSLKKAQKLRSNSYEIFNNMGNIYNSQGLHKKAISSYKKALKIEPNALVTLINLGLALNDKGDSLEAIKIFQKAIKNDPKSEFPYYFLANLYKKENNLDLAILNYKKALKINNNLIEALSNLALSHSEKGDHTKSITYFLDALKIDPANKVINKNLGMEYLRIGKYQEGWEKYEFRNINAPFNKNVQRIETIEDKTHENLMVISEQGLGDTIQFIRYIPYLIERGFKITLFVEEKLHSLIKISNIHQNPLSRGKATFLRQGYWLPLLSLPKFLNVSNSMPIITKPYIKSSKNLIDKWRLIFDKEKKPIIGINWQGNPNVEKEGVKGRSMKLEEFASIKKNTFKFLSLQKGYGSEQLSICSFKDNFVSFQEIVNQSWDFLETVAIIENCDLIITTDTCVAHLAGAIGKKTFLLLHSSSDWRWGINSENTFWYPSIKLFRQKDKNNWHDVIEQLSLELNQEF